MTDSVTKSPIFIVGSVHSGTTLLRRMIEADANIQSTPGETMLFAQDRHLARVFGNLRSKEQREGFLKFVYCRIRLGGSKVDATMDSGQECFGRHSFPKEHIRELFALTSNQSIMKTTLSTFDFVTSVQGKNRWLEKTPAHVLNLERILEIQPAAKIVELVRDPRDVLASKRVRRSSDLSIGKSFSQGGKENIKYDPFVDSLAWRRVIRAGSKARRAHPNSILRVSYEQLVRETDRVTRTVSEFLDLATTNLKTDIPWRNSTTIESTDVSQGISDKAVGRGSRELSETDIAICQLVNRRQMIALGYDLVTMGCIAQSKAIVNSLTSTGELLSRLIDGPR